MDKHAGLSNLISALNKLYTEQPALHVYDFDHQGFQWLSCDDVDNSVLAFIRRAGHDTVICIFNFTPKTLDSYVIGVPEAGRYQEIFNSDTAWYGGTDISNTETQSCQQQVHDFENSLTLTIPPLAALYVQKVGK